MPTDTFFSQTASLRALGGGRVWSLMISLFGDLAREEGQSIDGPVLSAIMQGLDVKPEAARVALHRLRKDGWLTSEKSGRISRHSLTAEGRAQSADASPRIYADPNKAPGAWQLILQPDPSSATEREMAQLGFKMIAPRVFVGGQDAIPPNDALSLCGGDVPLWLKQQAEPAELRESYAALLSCLSTLQSELTENTALPPFDTAILRCLIVHNWRRLVLKHPILPSALVDPAYPGAECHHIVWDLLRRYPRPALDDLENHRSAA